jgi:hypothetical protein
MPRVLVISDDGEMIWNERVNEGDFETEHFRRCLVDRVSWAVADAESSWRLSTVRPVQVDRSSLRRRSHVDQPQLDTGRAA